MTATIGKKWIHPTTGEVRYYVNDAYTYGGLELIFYNTGNISDAYLNDEHISNSEAYRMLDSIYKVYYTEDLNVHVQHTGYDRFARDIKCNIESLLHAGE